MRSIWAIHRAPIDAPARFAACKWDCERGAAPKLAETIFAATVELARAALPDGLVHRSPKPAPPGRAATGKPRRARRAPPPARELWLPGDFPAALARQGTIAPPASSQPPRPRRRPADPDSIVEVWEAPA